jgi:hypothetical protein
MHTNRIQSRHNSLFRFIASAAVGGLLSCASPLTAQSNPPSAPLPAPLAMAKTVFVANAGSTPSYPQGATMVYNSVYQALAQGHLYSLTTTPANADLVLETSFVAWYAGDTNVTPYSTPYAQLVVRDAKTQDLLWTISEPIRSTASQKKFLTYISDSGAKLVADLAALVNGNRVAPNSATQTKTPLSNEGTK